MDILQGKGVNGLNVHVNENCIGCGLCANMCPTVFTMLEEGVAAARDEIGPEVEGHVREAAESCPVAASVVEEKRPVPDTSVSGTGSFYRERIRLERRGSCR